MHFSLSFWHLVGPVINIDVIVNVIGGVLGELSRFFINQRYSFFMWCAICFSFG